MGRTQSGPRLFDLAPHERPSSLYFSSVPTREFGYYGSAFLKAARTLVRSSRRRRGLNSEPVPVLFMYRHSIELLAKAVVLAGNELLSNSGRGKDESEVFAEFQRSKHRLVPLLPSIRHVFEEAGWEWYSPKSVVRTFSDLRTIFEDLERVDRDSFTFRYPTSLSGDRSASKDFTFGSFSAYRALDQVAEDLETAAYGLRAEASR